MAASDRQDPVGVSSSAASTGQAYGAMAGQRPRATDGAGGTDPGTGHPSARRYLQVETGPPGRTKHHHRGLSCPRGPAAGHHASCSSTRHRPRGVNYPRGATPGCHAGNRSGRKAPNPGTPDGTAPGPLAGGAADAPIRSQASAPALQQGAEFPTGGAGPTSQAQAAQPAQQARTDEAPPPTGRGRRQVTPP